MRAWIVALLILLAGCTQSDDGADGGLGSGDDDSTGGNDFAPQMQHDGKRVQHHEPMAHCAAFGTKPFAPGATAYWNTSWDGRIYDPHKDAMHDAPPGVYTWNVTFIAHDSSDGAGRHQITVSFPVILGET